MSFEPLTFVLERLEQILLYEARILLKDEWEEIKTLHQELRIINSYLRDMDEVQRQADLSFVLQAGIQQLRDILNDIQRFLVEFNNQKSQQAHRNFVQKVKSFFSPRSNPLIRKHKLVKRVAGIRIHLNEMLQRPEGYMVENPPPQVAIRRKKRRPPSYSSIMKGEVIIGLEKDVETLVTKLIGKDVESGENSAVVGMGGSGKTTLAKLFYNHREVKEAFPIRAWVCVSQEWSTNDLLIQICAKFGVMLTKDEKSFPQQKLQEFLAEDPYLVVLDDVWDKHALEELLPTLLSGNGRVLVTTRKKNILKFSRIKAFYIHKVSPLTPEQSWELFWKIVGNYYILSSMNWEGGSNSYTRTMSGNCNDYMGLGNEMLVKCDGLPLAIVTVAGLLRTKTTIQQWEYIKERVIPILMKDDEDSYEAIKNVLELSYSDLPYHLKQCFLYLGIYKEDEGIHASDLIFLWIGEGFIIDDDESTLEEAGMNFLIELANRCMIQVVKNDYEGDVNFFRIHDLVRDFCIKKAYEEAFFQVSSRSTQSELSSDRAIINDGEFLALDNRHLRTLVYNAREDSPRGYPFERLKLLRVLSLENVKLGESSKHIGYMVLLRYLKLVECCNEVENVHFIKRLVNLMFLIIRQRNDPAIAQKLPDDMVSNMERLRVLELILGSCQEDLRATILSGVTNLRDLQTLTLEPACQGLVMGMQSALEMSRISIHSRALEMSRISIDLRALEMSRISSQQHLAAICDCITNNFLLQLQTLTLRLHHDQGQSGLGFDIQKMKWRGCQQLKCLYLKGKMIKPDEPWLPPPNLLLLDLWRTQIEDQIDMDKVINVRLYHLRELMLCDAYNGDRLTLVKLPQLEKLQLYQLKNLREWIITEDSLPILQELHIAGCPGLIRIPENILYIRSLQALSIYGISTELQNRIEKKKVGATQGGEDFHLLRHISTITML